MVIDRHWKVILANRACSVLFGRQVVGGKFLRDSLANPVAAQVIVNWPRSHEQDWTGSATHLDPTPLDQEVHHLLTLAGSALADVARQATAEPTLAICPWLRIADHIVRTIAVVARFDDQSPSAWRWPLASSRPRVSWLDRRTAGAGHGLRRGRRGRVRPFPG
jgi:hypothetical protein